MSFHTQYARNNGTPFPNGSWRNVFKTTYGKYVYKFDLELEDMWGYGMNKHEWETYVLFQERIKLPKGVRIPKMRFVDGVIISEYIKGTQPEVWCNEYGHECDAPIKCWFNKVKNVPLKDIKIDNVIIDKDGVVWLIDLGNGSTLDND